MSLQVTKLCDFGSGDGADIVCSVAWSQRGTYLSVGTHSGEAQIWDVSKIKLCAPVLHVLDCTEALRSDVLKGIEPKCNGCALQRRASDLFFASDQKLHR